MRKKLATILISTAIGFLLAELSLRIFFPGRFVYCDTWYARPLVSNGPYRVRLAPKFCGKYPGPDNSLWTVKTNRLGWRDPYNEVPESPIMLLGDSVFFGVGARDGKTIRDWTEEMSGIPTICRAVPAWESYSELKYLEMEGLALNPKYVVLGICMNDFKSLSDDEWAAMCKPYRRGLLRRSQAFNLVRLFSLRAWARIKWEVSGPPPDKEQPPPVFGPAYRRYERMQALCDGAEIGLIGVLLPLVDQEPYEQAEAIPIRNLVTVKGLTKEHFISSCHLTEDGQKIVASTIMEAIQSGEKR